MSIKSTILKILSWRKNTGDINPENLQKILVVRLDKIGDTLCLLPMIRELKNAYPEATIDVYAGIHNYFMFKHTTYVNHVYIKYRKRNPVKSLFEIWRMRTNHYDLIIDTMEIKFQKVLSLIAIKPTWLIGSEGFVSRYGLKNTDIKLYNHYIPFKAEHMTDYLLSYLQPLGIRYKNIAMEFPIGNESYTYAKSFLKP
ncbi:MAG: glycosyltransferase family 9 protein [Thiotrichaceae bacterium]|nr:glycosyltransferase family 9 protein [Thiotrichaceae bacterium]